jgi:hypothetical protein
VSKTLQEWLGEGDQLYDAALKEYRSLEAQLDELENRLTAKQAEVNQIAQVIGKPPVEPARKVAAQIIDGHDQQRSTGGSSTPSIIARALTGKQIHR